MHANRPAAVLEFPGPHRKPDSIGDAAAALPIHLRASASICCLSALTLSVLLALPRAARVQRCKARRRARRTPRPAVLILVFRQLLPGFPAADGSDRNRGLFAAVSLKCNTPRQ